MNRKDQYKRKFDFIIDKITSLPEKFKENDYYKDALFYRLQISIDDSLDLVAMLCKDLGITVKDDYSNLDELERISVFSKKVTKDLRRWNGLRNALVHKYNKIDEDFVLQEKDNVAKSLINFVKETEVIMNEKINFSKQNQE